MIHILKEFMDEPWLIIAGNMSISFNEELKKEVGPDHILYEKQAVAVAKREDNDDVVYWINELCKFALVHLTYSVETSSEYPKTQLLTLTDLEEHCRMVSQSY